ncbi:hypothetical protein EJ08DRAFT_668405 [Tothia fuscella]|uniref:mRNA N(6)-methyladenine demethylase n=1 Tax=Tothia fuscella TaxID=1048955 RepID=A0A9P4P0Q5_9PEZI|nr:hypothetical protein EJ08DRAFT_668405 [Tothia fuscella]
MNHSSRESHGNEKFALPPQPICDLYKMYQKMGNEAINNDPNVVDFTRGLSQEQMKVLVPVETILSDLIATAGAAFESHTNLTHRVAIEAIYSHPACTIYEHKEFPGLRLLPSLLPPECQLLMVNALFHRDLSNPLHTTNLTPDYEIPYPPVTKGSSHPASFFTLPQSSTDENKTFRPKNPHSTNKALNIAQFLQKKLRWWTLGSQYDWKTRSYPCISPTKFPSDIAALVTTLFKSSFVPESGVVLLYSPKDYMPVHRDVSEESPRGLASFSLGCDGLFIVARDKPNSTAAEPKQNMIVIRVRSGDVVQMSGESRWAWHAMPKVMAGTCPEYLKDWPAKAEGGVPKEYEKWRGYIRGKRLNISCRQVWDDPPVNLASA